MIRAAVPAASGAVSVRPAGMSCDTGNVTGRFATSTDRTA